MPTELLLPTDAGAEPRLLGEIESGRAPAPSRLDLARALEMHRTLALCVGGAVFCLLLLLAVFRKPDYSASAIFFVSPVATDVLPQPGAPAGFDSGRLDLSIQQMIQTFTRQDVTEAAVRSLPEDVWRLPGEPVSTAALRLAKSLTVERMGTSLQIQVGLSGPSKAQTEEALQAVIAQFQLVEHEEETGSSSKREQLLNEESSRIASALAVDRAEQNTLAESIGVARLTEGTPTPQDASVDELRRQLFDLRRARDLANAGLAGSNGGSGNGESEGTGGGAVTTSGLVSALNQRKSLLQAQMSGMTPANPLLKQDAAEVASIDHELSSAVSRSERERTDRRNQERARTVAGVLDAEKRVNRELQASTADAAHVAPKLQQYAALTADMDRLGTRAGQVDDALQTISLEAKAPSRVHLAVAPHVAAAPAGKRRILLLSAFPVGLLFGLMAAVVAHKRDRQVYLPGELENVFGFAPLAALPVEAEVSDVVFGQSHLRIAASIESSYRKQDARTFVFTAASADSNVEPTVFNVQSKLRELGYSALWISAHTLLLAEEEFEVAYGRGYGLLRSADRGTQNKSGIAAARLAWLKGEYDLVLIDAPPLLTSAEAEYAVRRSDAVILVSESGCTTRDELHEAGELLQRLRVDQIGIVLQDIKLSSADPNFRSSVKLAEVQSAKPAGHGPIDNEGAWQVLEPGSLNELHIPGDPHAAKPQWRTGTSQNPALKRAAAVRYTREPVERPKGEPVLVGAASRA